jgi:hypothetical protein
MTQPDDGTESKASPLKYLLLLVACVVGILYPYTKYGIAQEKLYRHPIDGELFDDHAFGIFMQNAIGSLISFIGTHYTCSSGSCFNFGDCM